MQNSSSYIRVHVHAHFTMQTTALIDSKLKWRPPESSRPDSYHPPELENVTVSPTHIRSGNVEKEVATIGYRNRGQCTRSGDIKPFTATASVDIPCKL